MTQSNADIRFLAFKNNVKMYQIADELGIHYVTLSTKLRKQLDTNEKEKIYKIIYKLSNKEEHYEE